MRAIKVDTDGGSVLIETEGDVEIVARKVGGGAVAGASPAELAAKLRDAGEAIADVCRTLHTKITGALGAAKPSELTLEFGVKLAGEAGVPLVTKGSVEGTFQVTAKWDFAKQPDLGAAVAPAPTVGK